MHIYLDKYEVEVAILPSHKIEDLQNLQDDSDESIQIKGDGSEKLQVLDLQINNFDIGILHHFRLGGGFEIAEEVYLVHLAELDCMVLHAWRPANVSVDKHTHTSHLYIIYHVMQDWH